MNPIFKKLDNYDIEIECYKEKRGQIIFTHSKDDGKDYEFSAQFSWKYGYDSVIIIDSDYHQLDNVKVDKQEFINWVIENHGKTIDEYLIDNVKGQEAWYE